MKHTSALLGGGLFMVWATFVVTLIEVLAGPWPDPDWLFRRDHSADWWMVVLTALLAVAAGGAWATAQRQLRHAQDATKLSARPLVIVMGGRLDISGDPGARSARIAAHVANVGTGPALDVRVFASFLAVDDSTYRNLVLLNAFAVQNMPAAEALHLVGATATMPPNSHAKPLNLSGPLPQPWPDDWLRGILYFQCYAEDIFTMPHARFPEPPGWVKLEPPS